MGPRSAPPSWETVIDVSGAGGHDPPRGVVLGGRCGQCVHMPDTQREVETATRSADGETASSNESSSGTTARSLANPRRIRRT